MVPELATCGATSAARPVALTLMVPALLIEAPGLPGWSNAIRPAMKLLLLTLAVDTIRLCTSTWLPRENATPFWFTITTCPFAWIFPAICEGSGPVTRFSVMLPVLGCWNTTA